MFHLWSDGMRGCDEPNGLRAVKVAIHHLHPGRTRLRFGLDTGFKLRSRPCKAGGSAARRLFNNGCVRTNQFMMLSSPPLLPASNILGIFARPGVL
jgi:hypothetical protein